MTTNAESDKQQSREEEIAAALEALKRARRRAEEIAASTGTALIQAVDGKPVRVQPRRPGKRG